MIEIRNIAGFIDQSGDIAAARASLPQGPRIDKADRKVLRRLAGEVAELAQRPIEAEKRELWKKHNALEPTRPVIFCDLENGWQEVFPWQELECRDVLARQWEFRLRKEIFWVTDIKCDYTIRPYFQLPHVYEPIDWGLSQTKIHDEPGWAYAWDSPIKTEADIDKLHFPTIDVDSRATQDIMGAAEEVLGDLLPPRLQTNWWWSTGMTQGLAELRGLQQIMVDYGRNPDLIHRIMGILRDGWMALLDQLEDQDLLRLNNDGSWVGSGGLGWSDELPQPDFAGKVRCEDMWGMSESQETSGVSPEMFAEFVFPYQKPLLERFGLNCYGCCEPLDKRWHVVKDYPNLRRLSVSAWADKAKMAEALGERYIYSQKPNPAFLAMDTLDEDIIRKDLRETYAAARNCRLEVIMKDCHTIRSEPQRAVRWVEIAREEAERAWQ